MGERLDVVAWHPDKAEFLRAALAPAAVTRIEIDTEEARAYAPAHQMSAAVGGAGLNSQLAGQLVGLRVTVVPD
jgi:N utilization substance protein A